MKVQIQEITRLSKHKKENNDKRIGLIAQEVNEVIKEVVSVGDDANKTYGVNYSELVPVLIKGMQDQQEIINSQKSKISDLESRLNKIEKMILEK